MKEAYRVWIALHRDFPKVERMGLGQKIDSSFLNALSTAYKSAYLPPSEKIVMLSHTISHLDMTKFFLQIAWESKLILTGKYSELISKLEEIGRQLGGWKKGLQSKTPIPHKSIGTGETQ